MKRVFFFFISLCATLAFPFVAAAQEPMILVRDAGKVTYASGSGVVWPAASITKLMTTLVLLDQKPNWNRSVTLTREDEVGGARLRVRVGAAYSAIDLLHAALMGSANNATNALARTSGLSKKNFVAHMNEKAHALGMTHTVFVDPTGMNPENVSTAEDLAVLIEEAKKSPLVREIGQKEVYVLKSRGRNPRTHTIHNTDTLLTSGASVVLGKTGYLVEARYNFAVVAETPAGTSRTVVVLNAPTKRDSFKLAQEFGKLAP